MKNFQKAITSAFAKPEKQNFVRKPKRKLFYKKNVKVSVNVKVENMFFSEAMFFPGKGIILT